MIFSTKNVILHAVYYAELQSNNRIRNTLLLNGTFSVYRILSLPETEFSLHSGISFCENLAARVFLERKVSRFQIAQYLEFYR